MQVLIDSQNNAALLKGKVTVTTSVAVPDDVHNTTPRAKLRSQTLTPISPFPNNYVYS